jgi:hypothetical protein
MKLSYIVFAAFAALVGEAQAQNIVQNADFSAAAVSSTNFPDWTVGPNGAPGTYTGLDLGPNTGSAANWIALAPYSYEGNGTVSQTLTTVAGDTYELSFYASDNNNSGAPNSLSQVYWGGGLALDFTNSFTATNTQQEFSTSVTASSSSTTLEFLGYQNSGWWDVDSVSVVKTGSAVPGPAALAPFAMGFVGLVRRRIRISA